MTGYMTSGGWEVRAEAPDGHVHVLRRLPTREEAEDHPVKLSNWRRVWVEKAATPDAPLYTDPPFPWSVEWVGPRAYMVAADGRKLASLLGTQAQREFVASKIETLA